MIQSPAHNSLRIHPLVWIILAMVAISFVVVQVSNSFNAFVYEVEPSCTVGVVGIDTSITLRGSSSLHDCDMFVQQFPQEYYRLYESPTGNIVCEGYVPQQYYTDPGGFYSYIHVPDLLGQDYYTVRSNVGLINVGGAICSALIGPTH